MAQDRRRNNRSSDPSDASATRPSSARRGFLARASGLLALAAVTTLAATTGVSASAPASNDLESLGTATGVSEDSQDLVAEVNELTRDPSGGYVTLVWSIENTGTEEQRLNWFDDEDRVYDRPNFAGITVRDDGERTRFHPVMNEQTICLCSRDRSSIIENEVEPGDKLTYWSLYAVPEDVEVLNVEVPEFGDITEVPIS